MVDLQRRAVAILQQSVLAVPAADRPRFWREQVRRDRVFRPLATLTDFARLDRQYHTD